MTNEIEIILVAGKFCKLQVAGKTTARAHAMQDGSWSSGSAASLTFASEYTAISWLTTVAIATALACA